MKKELEAKQKLLEDLQLQLKESKAENFEQNDKMAKAESEIQTLKSDIFVKCLFSFLLRKSPDFSPFPPLFYGLWQVNWMKPQ